MKAISSFCAVGLFLLVGAPRIYADLAPPKPSPSAQRAEGKVVLHTSLALVPDSKASNARLQISQNELQELRAALNSQASPSLAQRIAGSGPRTIVAGLFLFLSVSFGGVWLMRSGQSRGQKSIAAILMAAAVFGAAAIITRANAGPPPAFRWRNLPANLSTGKTTQGSVDIEIMPEGTGMKLILPLTPAKDGRTDE